MQTCRRREAKTIKRSESRENYKFFNDFNLFIEQQTKTEKKFELIRHLIGKIEEWLVKTEDKLEITKKLLLETKQQLMQTKDQFNKLKKDLENQKSIWWMFSRNRISINIVGIEEERDFVEKESNYKRKIEAKIENYGETNQQKTTVLFLIWKVKNWKSLNKSKRRKNI